MVIETIVMTAIVGVTYVTGDEQKKKKLRKIGVDLADVAKTTVLDVVKLTHRGVRKVKSRMSRKNNE